MMAPTAMRVGYGSANADVERTTNAVQKRAHHFFGLPKPSINDRRIKNFVNKHAKEDDLCDPSFLPNKTQKRSEQSKMLKLMVSDPETLHQGWRHAIQTIGKKALFVRIFKRWVNVLNLTLKDNDGNRFVKKDRGELTNIPTSSNP